MARMSLQQQAPRFDFAAPCLARDYTGSTTRTGFQAVRATWTDLLASNRAAATCSKPRMQPGDRVMLEAQKLR